MRLLNKIFVTLSFLGVLLSCLPTQAQTLACFADRVIHWIGFVGIGPLPGETCEGAGPEYVRCKKATSACSPPSETKGCCHEAGSPINLATGNTYIEETDLRVPGLGGGLALVRTWNSIMPPSLATVLLSGASSGTAPGMFGLNWRSTYEERVFLGHDGYLKYAQGDGSVWSFGGGVVVSPGNGGASLTNDLTNTWTITLKNGEKRVFSYSSGSLLSVADRNGNTTQLTYDAGNRLVTVTDAASRHLYFNYPNSSSTLVQTVTSDVGLSLAYSYDSQGRLTQVTQIDGTTLNFEYDGQSLITAVKDGNGIVLEAHTYDSRLGLTSNRADGVEHVTITYPPCFTVCPWRSY